MKYLLIILLLSLYSCCDTSNCKYKEGDDVSIKHKTSHNTATVTEVMCGCDYVIAYYSYAGVRRHRNVTEGELTEYIPVENPNVIYLRWLKYL